MRASFGILAFIVASSLAASGAAAAQRTENASTRDLTPIAEAKANGEGRRAFCHRHSSCVLLRGQDDEV
jgi:hypothetical protein